MEFPGTEVNHRHETNLSQKIVWQELKKELFFLIKLIILLQKCYMT